MFALLFALVVRALSRARCLRLACALCLRLAGTLSLRSARACCCASLGPAGRATVRAGSRWCCPCWLRARVRTFLHLSLRFRARHSTSRYVLYSALHCRVRVLTYSCSLYHISKFYSFPISLPFSIFLLGPTPKMSRFFFSELAGHSEQVESSGRKKRAGIATVVGSLI